MADNVAITAGSGTAIAADDINSVWYQRVKLSLGADGTAVDAVAGAGVVGTGVQRITLASDDPAVALLGTMDTDTGNIATAVQIMDDWDESDRAKVNPIVGQAGVAGGAGAVGATVQRVTLASDDPLVARVQAPTSYTQSIPRPSDTTAYAALDVIGPTGGGNSAISFTSIAASGSLVEVLGASLRIDKTAVISGETSYRLHLFSSTPPSALADNGAFDLPSGDRSVYLGYVNLGVVEDMGATVWTQADAVGKVVRMTGTGLFAYLQTVGAYTPASATVYELRISFQGK